MATPETSLSRQEREQWSRVRTMVGSTHVIESDEHNQVIERTFDSAHKYNSILLWTLKKAQPDG